MARGERLLVVRHGDPRILPGMPADTWHLSFAGEQGVRRLRQRLGPTHLVVSSGEPKALRTAELLEPDELRIDPRLNEISRPDAWDDSYEESVTGYLLHGEAKGWESAEAARDRLTQAVASLPSGAVVVGHGIALTLLVQSIHAVDPVVFWNDLRMPDAWLVTRSRLLRL